MSWTPRRFHPRPCCPWLQTVSPPHDGHVTLSGHRDWVWSPSLSPSRLPTLWRLEVQDPGVSSASTGWEDQGEPGRGRPPAPGNFPAALPEARGSKEHMSSAVHVWRLCDAPASALLHLLLCMDWEGLQDPCLVPGLWSGAGTQRPKLQWERRLPAAWCTQRARARWRPGAVPRLGSSRPRCFPGAAQMLRVR